MRNYQCQVCGEGILLEPAEVAKSGPLCMEHLFSEEFPALNRLADEASETEERPGLPPRSSQAAHTETQQEEGSAVKDSTTDYTEPDPEEEFAEFEQAVQKLMPILAKYGTFGAAMEAGAFSHNLEAGDDR